MVLSSLLITIITNLSTFILALPPLHTLPSPRSNFTTPLFAVDTFCYATSQDIKPIDVYQCEAALHAVRHLFNAYEDRLWSVPLTGHWFLGRWTRGRCSIEVVAWTPTAEDWFSTNDVAVLAEKIIRKCVERGLHTGGRMEVGPKRMFQVVVIHTDEIPQVATVA